MDAFTTLDAVAVPISLANVDTDQIIPARFLGKPRAQQTGAMFHDLRHDAQGRLKPDFVLNRPEFQSARIIVADRNFACGSSRENAVTVMVDNGFRAFVAPSFGDIFFNNCYQNGVLPIRVSAARADALRAMLLDKPGSRLSIDLAAQTLTGPDGQSDRFEIDPFRKDCLLRGLDDISLTLTYLKDIEAFEQRRRQQQDWV